MVMIPPLRTLNEIIHLAHVGYLNLERMWAAHEEAAVSANQQALFRAQADQLQERARHLRDEAHAKLEAGTHVAELSDAEFHALLGHEDSAESIGRLFANDETRNTFLNRAADEIEALEYMAEYWGSPDAEMVMPCPDCNELSFTSSPTCSKCGGSLTNVEVLPCSGCSEVLIFHQTEAYDRVRCSMCSSESLIVGAIPLAQLDQKTMSYLIEMGLRRVHDIQQHVMAIEPDNN